MMRFREHRGMLADSLKTTIEVSSRADVVSHIQANLQPFGRVVTDADISIKPYGGDDNRIGWKDVHIVTISDYGPIGFVEGNPR